jgi:hypothetical protein
VFWSDEEEQAWTGSDGFEAQDYEDAYGLFLASGAEPRVSDQAYRLILNGSRFFNVLSIEGFRLVLAPIGIRGNRLWDPASEVTMHPFQDYSE